MAELAKQLPVSRPAISQHLSVLRQTGLVSYEDVGTRNVYRLDSAGLETLSAWLDGFWTVALTRYSERVRQETRLTKPQKRGKRRV